MSAWEDCCRRCGLCCFEKSVDQRGRFVITSVPCRHLDIISRECRVYDKRFDVGEGCVKLTPAVVRDADWLPDQCAYRETIAKTKGQGLKGFDSPSPLKNWPKIHVKTPR